MLLEHSDRFAPFPFRCIQVEPGSSPRGLVGGEPGEKGRGSHNQAFGALAAMLGADLVVIEAKIILGAQQALREIHKGF